jgi:hypothetical protein
MWTTMGRLSEFNELASALDTRQLTWSALLAGPRSRP